MKDLNNTLTANAPTLAEDFTKVNFTLGLNLGNYFTKIVGDYGKDLFKTSGVEIPKSELMGNEMKDVTDQKIIEVDGKYYRMTDAEAIPSTIKKRDKVLLRALTAYSIARQLVKNKGYKKIEEAVVTMTVGLPINEYIAPKTNDELSNIEYLLDLISGTYNITYRGMSVKVTVPKKKVFVVAEGYVYYQCNYAEIKKANIEDLYILDFGSRTVDCVRIFENSPQKPTTLSDMGTLSLLGEIAARTNENMTEKKLEQLLRTGKTTLLGEEYTLDMFKDVVDAYVRKVVGLIDNTYKNMKIADKIILLGGGSNFFYDYMKEFYPKVAIDKLNKAEFVNAECYYIYALNKSKR